MATVQTHRELAFLQRAKPFQPEPERETSGSVVGLGTGVDGTSASGAGTGLGAGVEFVVDAGSSAGR